MTSNIHDELEERRDRIEADIDDYSGIEFRQQEFDNPHLVGQYRGLHKNYLNLGAHSLLLGDVQRARREFAASGLYIRQLRAEFLARWADLDKESKTHPSAYFRWGMCGALLSGHAGVIGSLASDIRALSSDFTTEHGGEGLPDAWRESHVCGYSQARSLACLIQGADTEAERARERCLATDDSQYTEQFAAIQRGLLDDDEPATRDALQRMADEHEQVFGESFPWKAIISHGTGAHLLLARERGMDVTAAELDSVYVPAGLDEYDIGDEFDLPRPEYVDDSLIPE